MSTKERPGYFFNRTLGGPTVSSPALLGDSALMFLGGDNSAASVKSNHRAVKKANVFSKSSFTFFLNLQADYEFITPLDIQPVDFKGFLQFAIDEIGRSLLFAKWKVVL